MEQISKLEDRIVEITQAEQKKRKMNFLKWGLLKFWDLWDNI